MTEILLREPIVVNISKKKEKSFMDNFMRLKGELEEAIDNYNETFATSGENEAEDINALMDVVKTSVRLFSSMLCEERTMDMNEALRIGVTPEVYSLLYFMELAEKYDVVFRIKKGKIQITSPSTGERKTTTFYKGHDEAKLKGFWMNKFCEE
jgi:hypothetical protein